MFRVYIKKTKLRPIILAHGSGGSRIRSFKVILSYTTEFQGSLSYMRSYHNIPSKIKSEYKIQTQ